MDADILANKRRVLSLGVTHVRHVCDKFTRSAEYKELGQYKKRITGSLNYNYKPGTLVKLTSMTGLVLASCYTFLG